MVAAGCAGLRFQPAAIRQIPCAHHDHQSKEHAERVDRPFIPDGLVRVRCEEARTEKADAKKDCFHSHTLPFVCSVSLPVIRAHSSSVQPFGLRWRQLGQMSLPRL